MRETIWATPVWEQTSWLLWTSVFWVLACCHEAKRMQLALVSLATEPVAPTWRHQFYFPLLHQMQICDWRFENSLQLFQTQAQAQTQAARVDQCTSACGRSHSLFMFVVNVSFLKVVKNWMRNKPLQPCLFVSVLMTMGVIHAGVKCTGISVVLVDFMDSSWNKAKVMIFMHYLHETM